VLTSRSSTSGSEASLASSALDLHEDMVV